ncbi:hypothetical protein [Pseudanabaena sp. 'Roaring Creek']|uniref:hypothetical protein n=1 Tax=Pseudanabaena sp. 'Roaring Creek' TaxID=1681830 RepID=UPI0006D7F76C|nr:hypothetical protein [Pseudanabaena sp. 'Roaring Creek']
MQVILDLRNLEADLAERLGSAEMAEEIIFDHVEEIAHGWTARAVSEQAVTLFTESLECPYSNMDLYAINNEEKIAQKLRQLPRFGVNRILSCIEQIDTEEWQIVALTVRNQIIYIHDNKENLFNLIKEAIAECLNH